MIQSLFCIGAGSCLGGMARYALSQAIDSRFGGGQLPLGTLAVNVLGCFAIGIISAALSRNGMGSDTWRLFLSVGFCGGFTTFSTFSNETFQLLSSGHVATALAYVASSIVIGVTMTMIAIKLI